MQAHGTVVVAPPGTETTRVPKGEQQPLDPADLEAAAGGDPRTVDPIEPRK